MSHLLPWIVLPWIALAGLWSGSAPGPYRADLQPVVEARAPDEVELLLGPGARSWPEPVRAALGERVRAEWPADRSYGPLVASVGVELRWPLVTARRGSAVLVPVVESDQLAIDGRLLLRKDAGPRRVVVLLDASASTNAPVEFEAADGSHERVSVLEAERRALEHLVDGLSGDWLEFGVIAFGEATWPVAEPGASAESLRAALARFRAEHPAGEGRTDAICALWTARDWLADSPSGVAREIVVLTDGDAPVSGRFSSGPARNASECPASHSLAGEGPSDPLALLRFARSQHGDVTITPLIFEPERRALAWSQVAERGGGTLVRVPGPEAIDAVLPALVAGRIARATARNTTTGAVSADLLQADRSALAGSLGLAPGANDVELRVESDRGIAALLRFRVYSAPHELERALAELRERNHGLESRAAEAEQAGERTIRARTLDVHAAPPASAAP
ncbi:MAG TPA: vWA domain-containing protein [Myxococcota bacterium]|nr:vWA domain-containing protein [Myxococcota bacterium]